MSAVPPGSGELWTRSALGSGPAVRTASQVAAVALVVAALVSFVGGWPWPVSAALGGAIVLVVLWGSARLLIAGARRWPPAVALLLALGLYAVAVVGLLVLAVAARPGHDADGWLRAPGVAVGVLVVLAAWTVALLVVHVKHDRPRVRTR